MSISGPEVTHRNEGAQQALQQRPDSKRSTWWLSRFSAGVFVAGLASILVMSAFSLTPAQEKAKPAAPAGARAEADAEFILSEVGQFNHMGRPRRLFASLRNRQSEPQRMRFCYDPLLAPEQVGGKLAISIVEEGDRFLVRLPVHISSEQSDAAAFEALKTHYPEHAGKLPASCVAVMPIRSLSLEIPDLPTWKLPGVTIKPSTYIWDFGPDRNFLVELDTPNRATAEQAKTRLAGAKLRFHVGFNGRSSKMNVTDIHSGTLKSTNFYKRLFGDGDVAYVRRDALLEVADTIHLQLGITQIIEDPKHFRAGFVDGLVAKLGKLTDLDCAAFDQKAQQSLFHSADLAPSVLTKLFKEQFEYHERERRVTFNNAGGGGIKIGVLFGAFNIAGGAKGSYSRDEFTKMMSSAGCKVAVEGTVVIPKSIRVHEIRRGLLDSFGHITTVETWVSDPESRSATADVNLKAIAQDRLMPGLAERVARLETRTHFKVETREYWVTTHTTKEAKRPGAFVLTANMDFNGKWVHSSGKFDLNFKRPVLAAWIPLPVFPQQALRDYDYLHADVSPHDPKIVHVHASCNTAGEPIVIRVHALVQDD